jgi:hypothetical protein
MKQLSNLSRLTRWIVGVGTAVLLQGCSLVWMESSDSDYSSSLDQAYGRSDPGVVEYVWEPPMVDVIDVPPGLDPEGHYYRPAHQEVVEIRQGRWKYYRPN